MVYKIYSPRGTNEVSNGKFTARSWFSY